MPKTATAALARPPIPLDLVERRIYIFRGQKVMLDTDLAALYRVPTSRLNEAVKRNLNRFPDDFMFRLTQEEADRLTSHFAMSKTGRGGRPLCHTHSPNWACRCCHRS